MERWIGCALGVLSTVGCGSSTDSAVDEPQDDAATSSVGSGGALGTAGASATGGAKGTGGATGKGGSTGTGGSKGTGGTTGTGGATGSGGATGTGGSTAADAGPPHVVGKCDSLAAVGQWEKINPPVDFATGNGTYGTNGFAVDPLNAGTVYLGTSGLGIWKTTDCGATWAHVNTGASPLCPSATWTNKSCAQLLDTGRQWSFAIDPVDSKVLYANSGYGQGPSGMFKSENGGVDWTELWPGTDPEKVKVATFTNHLVVDPYDHNHLLLDFHQACSGGGFCVADSKDAGATWKVVDGGGSMAYVHESRIAFLDNSQTWVYAGGNIWRTADGGASFQQVYSGNVGGFLYRAKDGTYYFSSDGGIVKSKDGIAWSLVPNSGNLVKGLTGDGTNMFASSSSPCFDWGTNLQPYETAKETDGGTWTKMTSPGMTQGGYFLGMDLDHHVLYSSNCAQGFWRVVTR
jgi:hypothetical protein